MVMELRPYQVIALDNLWSALKTESNVLLEAACSAGKTLLFSEIIRRLLDIDPSYRALVLLDREELVRQTRDKIIEVSPHLMMDIGIVCAGVSNEKTLDRRITVASRQSLVNHLGRMAPVHLIVCDECHTMAVPRDNDPEPDQFGTIIGALRGYNPKTRLIGVTATPYRLGDGYIYGTRNAKGCRPYFNNVHHRIMVSELLAGGYLAPLKGKTVAKDGLLTRLLSVSMTAGEYNLGELSDVMCQGAHITSAVDVWTEHASDRNKTVIFGVTIGHAEKLAAAFNSRGIPAIAIHSDTDDITNYVNMQALRNGGAKVFCSVGRLTTGMDVPDIDCILMARATKSTALYKQMIGRGQRTAEGKVDCLILDIVGNGNEHGWNLDNLNVRYKSREAPVGINMEKFCPKCDVCLHPAVRICPDCGYEYPRTDFPEAKKPDMVDVEYGSLAPVEAKVLDYYASVHKGAKSGKETLRIRFSFDEVGVPDANIFLCFSGDGFTGYAVQKGLQSWKTLTLNENYPDNADAACERAYNEIICPNGMTLNLNGKWPEIMDMRFDEAPF